jgi:hypothetical protein
MCKLLINVKESGRSIFCGIIPATAWKLWGKPWVGNAPEIRIGHFPNQVIKSETSPLKPPSSVLLEKWASDKLMQPGNGCFGYSDLQSMQQNLYSRSKSTASAGALHRLTDTSIATLGYIIWTRHCLQLQQLFNMLKVNNDVKTTTPTALANRQ